MIGSGDLIGSGKKNPKIYDHPGHPLHGRPVARRMDPWAFPLIEVFCVHGVGHPIPESVEYLTSLFDRAWGVHGCDGCCFGSQHD